MRSTRLTPVPDSEVADPISEPPPPTRQVQTLLYLTLKTLSKKTLIALSACADLLMVSSAFIMWLKVMAEPTDLQLVGLGGYGGFILIAVWMRNRYASRE